MVALSLARGMRLARQQARAVAWLQGLTAACGCAGLAAAPGTGATAATAAFLVDALVAQTAGLPPLS